MEAFALLAQTADDAKAAAAASEIENTAKKIPELFPEGTGGAPSEAKPEVWEKWAEFTADADELVKASNELVATMARSSPALSDSSMILRWPWARLFMRRGEGGRIAFGDSAIPAFGRDRPRGAGTSCAKLCFACRTRTSDLIRPPSTAQRKRGTPSGCPFFFALVEAAGIEPASASNPPVDLHV